MCSLLFKISHLCESRPIFTHHYLATTTLREILSINLWQLSSFLNTSVQNVIPTVLVKVNFRAVVYNPWPASCMYVPIKFSVLATSLFHKLSIKILTHSLSYSHTGMLTPVPAILPWKLCFNIFKMGIEENKWETIINCCIFWLFWASASYI
jgi:hypothetical protein